MQQEKPKIGFEQKPSGPDKKTGGSGKLGQIGFGDLPSGEGIPAVSGGRFRVPGIGRDLSYAENVSPEIEGVSGVRNDIREIERLTPETQEVIKDAYNEVLSFYRKVRDVAAGYEDKQRDLRNEVEKENPEPGAEANRWARHGLNVFHAFKWRIQLAVRAFLADREMSDHDLWGLAFQIRDEALADYHDLFELMRMSAVASAEKEKTAAAG